MPGEQTPEISPQDHLRVEILAELNNANFMVQQIEGKYVHTAGVAGHALELTVYPDEKYELKVDGNITDDSELIEKIKEHQLQIKI